MHVAEHNCDGRMQISIDTNGRNSYTISMKTIVSEKGQITIPQLLRRRLGIRPGQTLDVREEAGRLTLMKAGARDPVDAVYGILKLKKPTDQIITELRGKALGR